MVKCEGCGERPPKNPRSRFCADPECLRVRARERRRKADGVARERAAAARGEAVPVVEPVAEVPGAAPADKPAGGIFTATMYELEKAGRLHTAAGQQAIKLASRLDYGATDTGSSLAALGRQHLAALEEALRDLEVAEDPVDEVARKRAARAG